MTKLLNKIRGIYDCFEDNDTEFFDSKKKKLESENMNKKFWFIWNESAHNPRYKHDSLKSAQIEAVRLSKLHPDNVFIVLESIEHYVVNTVRREVHVSKPDFQNKEIPF